jgi:nucleoside 2-deoxyribosyltransferase
MPPQHNICIIGEVCIDFTLTDPGSENKLRFGGVVHAARALCALKTQFDLLYLSPDYLDAQIKQYVMAFDANRVTKIGSVLGAPNVMFINEPKEAGSQGYEFLLREEQTFVFDFDLLAKRLLETDFSDIMIFPGAYHLPEILKLLNNSKAKIHIDLANFQGDIDDLKQLDKKFETIFLSAPSFFFDKFFESSIDVLIDRLTKTYADSVILKENRGGSRYFNNLGECVSKTGAQLRSTTHSVGVGDCYDVAYISNYDQGVQFAMNCASWIAADYATTTFPDDFIELAHQTLLLNPKELLALDTLTIPWEIRPKLNIYIAAPDFENSDKFIIDDIVNCLKYHNFSPRLPIRENGLVNECDSINKKEQIFEADMKLINSCNLLLAILTWNDPGTLIEIGLAKGQKKPVLVYDPYKQASNLMLTQIPDFISSDKEKIITKMFELLRVHNEEN